MGAASTLFYFSLPLHSTLVIPLPFSQERFVVARCELLLLIIDSPFPLSNATLGWERGTKWEARGEASGSCDVVEKQIEPPSRHHTRLRPPRLFEFGISLALNFEEDESTKRWLSTRRMYSVSKLHMLASTYVLSESRY